MSSQEKNLSQHVRSGCTIDDETFRSALHFIRPTANELTWQSIPWQTDLFEGTRIAHEVRKPVLLWTMNGNPLGCT